MSGSVSALRRSYLAPEPAEIAEKHSFGPELHAYRLRLLEPDARPRFDFRPGQFNMLWMPGMGEVAISISSDPDEPLLEHTVRIVGRVTRAIAPLGVGDVVGIRGPYGNGWPLDEARFKDVLVVTGGLGCAPVSGAIDYMFRRRSNYGRITILHGVKKPADLVHQERFEAWRRHQDAQVLLTSDDPDRHWKDRTGVVTELFDEVAFDPSRTVLLMCGPEVMMTHAVRILRARGLPTHKMFVSLERNMKCAVGLCGHCQYLPYFVCKDGPIFRFSDVERLFAVGHL